MIIFMSKKDYLEFIFLMSCTFVTLLIFKFIWSMDNCLVGKTNELLDLGLIDLFWSYCLYFILGILPFGWSFILYMLLKTKIPIVGKFFSVNNKKPIADFYNSSLFYILAALIYVPLPLIIYDLLLC